MSFQENVDVPKISNIPGGWTKLATVNSNMINECIIHFLTTYDKTHKPELPLDVKVEILQAASQVVNGLNIFLIFRISPSAKDKPFKPLTITAKFYLNIINKGITVQEFSIGN